MAPSPSRPAGATSRRRFLKASASLVAGCAAASFSGPIILGAQDKAGSQLPVLGEGAYRYEAIHSWGEVPAHIQWGETHGVAIDEAGMIYIKHRSDAAEPMDAIVVFDPAGKFVRSFGKEYHRGGHGIDIRKEGNEEFLYLSDVAHCVVAKTSLKGEQVWVKKRPEEPGVYKDETARFVPTNVCFLPDGGFVIADGYGSNFLHKYDKDAKWVKTWGGTGTGPGQCQTPHGIWLDNRPGREPSLVVADRANARLQYFTLDGVHMGFNTDVSFPANFDIRGDVLLCPDLHARVTLFDKDNKVISHLGYDPEWTKQVQDGFRMRGQPETWKPGRFIHPHDACFDKDGNIFVVEWVAMGRVTKLRAVS